MEEILAGVGGVKVSTLTGAALPAADLVETALLRTVTTKMKVPMSSKRKAQPSLTRSLTALAPRLYAGP